jgi:hypothetical protein
MDFQGAQEMIWLTQEKHAEILADPLVIAADDVSLLLAARAKELGTAEAVHASARAAEACYWLMQSMVHEAAVQAQAEQNGDGHAHP